MAISITLAKMLQCPFADTKCHEECEYFIKVLSPFPYPDRIKIIHTDPLLAKPAHIPPEKVWHENPEGVVRPKNVPENYLFVYGYASSSEWDTWSDAYWVEPTEEHQARLQTGGYKEEVRCELLRLFVTASGE